MCIRDRVNTYSADKDHPWEYTWLEFDGLRVKEALELAGLTMDNPVYHSNARDLSLELKNEMLYIANHSDQSPFHLIGHLYLFLDYLTRSSSSRRMMRGGKLQDFYIREATSFIEQNFQNDISVEDIAAFCNLNRSYFGKIFRDAVGKSPQEFLISYRMTKAAELLKLTELTIKDIGNAVGYPSQLHFSRAFKKTYGISPREWRSENKIASAAGKGSVSYTHLDVYKRQVYSLPGRIPARAAVFRLRHGRKSRQAVFPLLYDVAAVAQVTAHGTVRLSHL